MANVTASNVIKCTSCNIVICELLAFVQNKVDVMDEESIVRLCTTSFSEENIETAKKLLFDSITKDHRNIRRKRSGKAQRDLYDVISIFKQVDPEHIPIFVARELHKLPPVTFDHIDATRLLKDIVVLQNEVKNMKLTFVTEDEIKEVKKELKNLKNLSQESVSNFDMYINKKRGGSSRIYNFCPDSGPIGLSHIDGTEMVTPDIGNRNSASAEREISEQAGILPSLSPQCNSKVETVMTKQSASAECNNIILCEQAVNVPSLSPRCIHNIETAMTNQPVTTTNPMRAIMVTHEQSPVNSRWPKSKTFADTLKDKGEWKKQDVTNEWKTKQRKRLRNRLIGIEGKANVQPNEKFRAAKITDALFINNVDKETTEKDILDYIKQKTNVLDITLKKIQMQKIRPYNAYKIFVPHTKTQMFLNDDLWPEGIRFRRFVYFNRDNYNQGEDKKLNKFNG